MRKLAILGLALATAGLAACGDSGTHSTTQVAATVNGASISMQSYDSAVASLRGRIEGRTGHAANTSTPAGAHLLATVEAAGLRQLIAQTVIEQLAAAHHVTVSDADVNTALQTLKSAAGDPDQLVADLASAGLSDADTHVAIRALLLQQRLRAADSATYDSDFANAVRDAHITVYAAPCTTQHAYPACVQGL